MPTYAHPQNNLAIHTLLQDEYPLLKQLLNDALQSDVPLMAEVASQLIQSGGKRLRPLLLLLTGHALGGLTDEHREVACVIELIHSATLLHDDVVDESTLRRHQPTANARWGNQTAVLVGDFLYARAFQIMARRNNIPVMRLLAQTTAQLSEGEIQQLMQSHDCSITEADYLNIIQSKTATLFQASTHAAAIISKSDAARTQACADYGCNLGMAFQIMDDLLDYQCTSEASGKQIGDDWAEGKLTLPLIYALKHGDTATQTCIKQALNAPEQTDLSLIRTQLQACGALTYTQQKAADFIRQAQTAASQLPESRYRDCMHQLAEDSLTRTA